MPGCHGFLGEDLPFDRDGSLDKATTSEDECI